MTQRAQMVGLDEFKKAMQRLSDAANADALEGAGQAGLLRVQNAAKQKSPKLTRTLSRSIHIETLEKRRNYVELAVGTDVVYAAIQEFGGVIHQTNAWGKGIQQTITIKPQPYLRPAWDENIDAAVKEAGKALADILKAAL